VDLVTGQDLEVAPLVARAERPEVPVARGGIRLGRVVLDLEVEGPVRRLVLDRVHAALVEARGAILADAEEAKDAAGGNEVAARHAQEGDVVAIFLERGIEATELHGAPAVMLQAHPRITRREGAGVRIDQELRLELPGGAQSAAQLLVAANAQARVRGLHLVAGDDRVGSGRRLSERRKATTRDGAARGRRVLATLAHDLGIDLPVQDYDGIWIRPGVSTAFAAALLRVRKRNCERRTDRQDESLLVHSPMPPCGSYMWNIKLLPGTGEAYRGAYLSSR
jgi:hypothetical protein